MKERKKKRKEKQAVSSVTPDLRTKSDMYHM